MCTMMYRRIKVSHFLKHLHMRFCCKINFFLVPGVIYIERLWTSNENVKMMYGNVFMRPFETYHVTTRKFLEQVNTIQFLYTHSL